MNSSKKVVLLGHFGVGKTSLLRRFIDNQFSEDYIVTIGVQIKKKLVSLNDNTEISLIIWDLEGNTTIKKARSSYLLGASAFIYVFDASRIETYKEINDELDYLKTLFPKAIIKTVGNKSDLIEIEDIEKNLQSIEFKPDIFTSAKTGENVEAFFCSLAEKLSND